MKKFIISICIIIFSFALLSDCNKKKKRRHVEKSNEEKICEHTMDMAVSIAKQTGKVIDEKDIEKGMEKCVTGVGKELDKCDKPEKFTDCMINTENLMTFPKKMS